MRVHGAKGMCGGDGDAQCGGAQRERGVAEQRAHEGAQRRQQYAAREQLLPRQVLQALQRCKHNRLLRVAKRLQRSRARRSQRHGAQKSRRRGRQPWKASLTTCSTHGTRKFSRLMRPTSAPISAMPLRKAARSRHSLWLRKVTSSGSSALLLCAWPRNSHSCAASLSSVRRVSELPPVVAVSAVVGAAPIGCSVCTSYDGELLLLSDLVLAAEGGASCSTSRGEAAPFSPPPVGGCCWCACRCCSCALHTARATAR
eukprot:scaffold659_cov329-Prasinococcus_capsulatus_cf.AAC.28